MTQANIPLSTVIIGAGISGLSASIFLAQAGHHVTILERRLESDKADTSGGIALFNNSISCYKAHNVWDAISEVVDSHDTPHAVSTSGATISRVQKARHFSMVHRADFLQILTRSAIERGVSIHFGARIVAINETDESASVQLDDGTVYTADLVVGADGINSYVRSQIMPDIQPIVTESAVHLVDILEDVMKAHPSTLEIWNDTPYRRYQASGLVIVCWTMSKHQPPVYHLQFCDYEYGDRPAYAENADSSTGKSVITVTDTSGFKERWSDFEAGMGKVVQSVEQLTRWRIAVVPPLTTHSSKLGRIVLVGDSASAVRPFAGQGANMSIESAASLAVLLNNLTSKTQIKDALQVYDSLRIPRIQGLREIIAINMKVYAMQRKDNEHEGSEDSYWRNMSMADMFAWLEGYDAMAEAEKAWDHREMPFAANNVQL